MWRLSRAKQVDKGKGVLVLLTDRLRNGAVRYWYTGIIDREGRYRVYYGVELRGWLEEAGSGGYHVGRNDGQQSLAYGGAEDAGSIHAP